MTSNPETTNKNFPYKTLIWMVFAGFALLIFKPELKSLISEAEELTVFGVNIKTSKNKANQLESKIIEYQDNIASLSTEIANQETRVDSLLMLKEQLLKDLEKCPESEIKLPVLEGKFQKISTSNTDIKNQTRRLSDMTIFKRKDN